MAPRINTFVVFMSVVLLLIALGMAIAYELNRPLEVFLPTFEPIDVSPAPMIDLGELGIE